MLTHFVSVNSGLSCFLQETTPGERFWTTVVAKTLQQKEVGDRLAQQSLSPVLNDCSAYPSRASLGGLQLKLLQSALLPDPGRAVRKTVASGGLLGRFLKLPIQTCLNFGLFSSALRIHKLPITPRQLKTGYHATEAASIKNESPLVLSRSDRMSARISVSTARSQSVASEFLRPADQVFLASPQD
jgi:hypothetical protein